MKVKDIELKRVVNEIRKDKDIIAIMLFGSYARNKEYARDVDLCVVLDKNYPAGKLFTKRLKYLSRAPDKFDIQIFQQLPLYVRISVLREGKFLYLRDKKKIYALAYESLKNYNFFERHYKDYIEQIRK